MLEPQPNQKVFDPCCGSGGMFVQSDAFRGHDHGLSFFGQESKEFTYQLCRMNLFIHGPSGDIRLGNSYTTSSRSIRPGPTRSATASSSAPTSTGSSTPGT